MKRTRPQLSRQPAAYDSLYILLELISSLACEGDRQDLFWLCLAGCNQVGNAGCHGTSLATAWPCRKYCTWYSQAVGASILESNGGPGPAAG